jgi:L-fuconolactonase
VIDAHLHLWRLDRGDYDWLADEDPSLSRDFTLEEWAGEAGPLGVTAGVLVQAAPTVAETAYVLDLARSDPSRILGVVGWRDLAAPGAAAAIRAGEPSALVALRPWLQAIDDLDWVLAPSVMSSLAAMEARGLVYEALIRPAHLPRVLMVARRLPGLNVVVDHGAKPDVAAGELDRWAADLTALAACPNVFCKVSGLLTEAAADHGAEDVRPYVETILGAFGPGRVLWGSDWPVVTTRASYAEWFAMASVLVPHEWHDDVFDATARRAYGLATPTEGDQAWRPR